MALATERRRTKWVPRRLTVLVHRIEEARQVANRKRDDRQKRREKIAAAPVRTPDIARN